MSRRHTRAYEVSMIVHTAPDATLHDVTSLINDLTWVGGCRDPDSPAFKSCTPSKVRIFRAKQLDKP